MSATTLRILFLTYQGGMAGSTYSITYLAKGLADRGHRVFAGVRPEMPIWDLIEHPGITRVPMQIKSKFDVNNWCEIRDLVRKEGIQVINAQSSYDRFTSIFAKLRFKLDVQIVHTRRQNPLSAGGWLQRQFYLRNTAGIVVISEGLKRIFVEKGYPEEHIRVIHNGIPKQRFQEWSKEKVDNFRKKLNLQPEDKVVGCISRFKEQPQLIEAIAKLNDPRIKLIFAGAFPEQIQPYLDQHGIQNEVHLLGKLPPEDILSVYRLLDVNVLASTMDGFGLVLVEAMAMECPVIATNFGGIPDVVEDEVNGLLFENNNIDGLKEKIERVLDDNALRQRLIQNGLVTAFERFTMEKTISTYEEYFSDLITEN